VNLSGASCDKHVYGELYGVDESLLRDEEKLRRIKSAPPSSTIGAYASLPNLTWTSTEPPRWLMPRRLAEVSHLLHLVIQ